MSKCGTHKLINMDGMYMFHRHTERYHCMHSSSCIKLGDENGGGGGNFFFRKVTHPYKTDIFFLHILPPNSKK